MWCLKFCQAIKNAADQSFKLTSGHVLHVPGGRIYWKMETSDPYERAYHNQEPDSILTNFSPEIHRNYAILYGS